MIMKKTNVWNKETHLSMTHTESLIQSQGRTQMHTHESGYCKQRVSKATLMGCDERVPGGASERLVRHRHILENRLQRWGRIGRAGSCCRDHVRCFVTVRHGVYVSFPLACCLLMPSVWLLYNASQKPTYNSCVIICFHRLGAVTIMLHRILPIPASCTSLTFLFDLCRLLHCKIPCVIPVSILSCTSA